MVEGAVGCMGVGREFGSYHGKAVAGYSLGTCLGNFFRCWEVRFQDLDV